MGQAVSANASIGSSLGGSGILGKVLTTVLSNAFAPEAPSPAPTPVAPAVVETPETPTTATETAVPEVDTQAAELRSRKRRATASKAIAPLSDSEDDSIVRSLLGE